MLMCVTIKAFAANPFHPLFCTRRWLVGSESDTAIKLNFDQISYARDIASKIEYSIID